jgi:hypothetical protein
MPAESNPSFDRMIGQFNTLEQLQDFCRAQYKTIIDLSKKITRIEEEKKHLEKLLQDSVPLIPKESNLSLSSNITDEEVICRTQLKLLKDIAQDRELTLEETKKVDTYTKLLQMIMAPKKMPDSKAKNIKTDDLIALLETEANGLTIK